MAVTLDGLTTIDIDLPADVVARLPPGAPMDEEYGADHTEAHTVRLDQQWAVVKDDAEMEAIFPNNDRSQFEMVLEQKVKDLMLDRHEKNGVLFDMFFAESDFQTMLLSYLVGTYDEFRREASA